MQLQQFEAITKKHPRSSVRINGAALSDKRDRTLLLGYMENHDVFHVYIAGNVIFRVIHRERAREDDWNVRYGDFSPNELVPDKRVFPEASDADFCAMLMDCDTYVPFTAFNGGRKPAQGHFYGRVLGEEA